MNVEQLSCRIDVQCCMHVVIGTTVIIATYSFVLGHFVESFVPRYGQYVRIESLAISTSDDRILSFVVTRCSGSGRWPAMAVYIAG